LRILKTERPPLADSLEGRVGNITTMMKTLNKVQKDYDISYEQLSDLITRMHDYLINFNKEVA
jgi:hypothetical protein